MGRTFVALLIDGFDNDSHVIELASTNMHVAVYFTLYLGLQLVLVEQGLVTLGIESRSHSSIPKLQFTEEDKSGVAVRLHYF